MSTINTAADLRPHFVYRIYGRRGRLLYIGCSMDLPRRLAEHHRSGLGRLMHRVETEGPFDFTTARAIERAAIEATTPPFNTEWTSRYQRGKSRTKAYSSR